MRKGIDESKGIPRVAQESKRPIGVGNQGSLLIVYMYINDINEKKVRFHVYLFMFYVVILFS